MSIIEKVKWLLRIGSLIKAVEKERKMPEVENKYDVVKSIKKAGLILLAGIVGFAANPENLAPLLDGATSENIIGAAIPVLVGLARFVQDYLKHNK